MSEDEVKALARRKWDAYRGVVGIVKAVAHIDRPPDDVIAARLATCKACEHFKGNNCELCGCFVQFKIRNQSEHCPAGKW